MSIINLGKFYNLFVSATTQKKQFCNFVFYNEIPRSFLSKDFKIKNKMVILKAERVSQRLCKFYPFFILNEKPLV